MVIMLSIAPSYAHSAAATAPDPRPSPARSLPLSLSSPLTPSHPHNGGVTPVVGSTIASPVFTKSYAMKWMAAPGTVFSTEMLAPRYSARSPPSSVTNRRTQSSAER